jgi:hypothetical protein
MTKKIILLSDGTGNSAAKVWRTNVWRLFQSLDLTDSSQIAIYDDGVGTSSFKPLAILGGAFGFGLKRNVLDLYKFVCRNYQTGDKIYGFGFSRGAFTIRIVAGLVLNQGLVSFGNEADLDRKVRAAFRAYRHEKYSPWNLQYLFRLVLVLLDRRFYTPRLRPVPTIEFLGVWDTVAAYGLPVDEMTRGVDQWIWPLELPNTHFNPAIIKARHALAIDDERATFHPVLWDEDDTNTQPAGQARATSGEKLLQVWFTGMHANVGGGYPDDALANVSLSWMMAEAQQSGLVFKEIKNAEPDALLSANSAKDKDGRLYDSRSGARGYYRYSPRNISDFYTPMAAAAAKGAVGSGKLTPKIHESVFGRIKVGAHLYAPIGLPVDYEVVTGGNASVIYNPLPPSVATPPAMIQPNVQPATEGPNAPARHLAQEDVWDLVWRKRVNYFLTVFATGYLLLYPLFRDTYAFEELRTRLRIVSDTIRLVGSALPSVTGRWIDAYAREPGWFLVASALVVLLTMTSSNLGALIKDRMRYIWVKYLPQTQAPPAPVPATTRANIGSSIVFVLLVLLAIFPVLSRYVTFPSLSGELGKDVTSGGGALRAYTAPPVNVILGLYVVAYYVPGQWIRPLRQSTLYQAVLRAFKYYILPFVSAFGLLLLVIELGAHYAFNVVDSFGYVCIENEALKSDSRHGFEIRGDNWVKEFVFDTGDSGIGECLSTGTYLSTGKDYRISVVRDGEQWTFFGEDSFMGAQPISRLPWYKEVLMAAMFPLRRTFDRPWEAVILRIGGKGLEEDFLDRPPPPQSDDFFPGATEKIPDHEALGEKLKPKRDGELFVYLNKPVFGVSRWIGNSGRAKITISYPAD